MWARVRGLSMLSPFQRLQWLFGPQGSCGERLPFQNPMCHSSSLLRTILPIAPFGIMRAGHHQKMAKRCVLAL